MTTRSQPSLPLASRPKVRNLKPHHTHAYRKRHFAALAVSGVMMLALVLKLGIVMGSHDQLLSPQPASNATVLAASTTAVRSSLGFALDFDSDSFSGSGAASNQPVSQDALSTNQSLSSITLRPRAPTTEARYASNSLNVQVFPGSKELTALKQDPVNRNIPDSELAARLFSLTNSANFDVTITSTNVETIDGVAVTKKVYQYTPHFNGGLSYAVVWSGVLGERPFAVKLTGLVGGATTPDIFIPVLKSLKLTGSPKVEAASTTSQKKVQPLDSKYISDLVSPAVVKIYHVVCANLIAAQRDLGYSCDGGTGSGFLVSSDGYIATNGHVVVESAKDAFVNVLQSDSGLIKEFLTGYGLSSSQIQQLMDQPQELAAIVAKIYDLPDEQLHFENTKEVTLVALGDKPIEIKSYDDIEKLVTLKETSSVKKAILVNKDYSSKDQLVVASGDPAGFSSSDVALLKIDAVNTPFVGLSNSVVTQNQKVIVFGFPGDAENSLVDSSDLSVSVTDGTISSIRNAAGGKSKLYQTDADASHGNSGGPAVNEAGEAIGLLTYRVASDNEGNAAKSYLRDIKDFKALATEKGIVLQTNGGTQAAWREGLDLYSHHHYSAALKRFNYIRANYPEQRLVAGYIDTAKQQIAAGNDATDSSVAIILAVLLALFLVALVTVILIIRHHINHRAYLLQATVASPHHAVPVWYQHDMTAHPRH